MVALYKKCQMVALYKFCAKWLRYINFVPNKFNFKYISASKKRKTSQSHHQLSKSAAMTSQRTRILLISLY
jgi:hypothetical protein